MSFESSYLHPSNPDVTDMVQATSHEITNLDIDMNGSQQGAGDRRIYVSLLAPRRSESNFDLSVEEVLSIHDETDADRQAGAALIDEEAFRLSTFTSRSDKPVLQGHYTWTRTNRVWVADRQVPLSTVEIKKKHSELTVFRTSAELTTFLGRAVAAVANRIEK